MSLVLTEAPRIHPLQDSKWIPEMDSMFSNYVGQLPVISHYVSVHNRTNGIYDEHHAMIAGFWIETFIFIMGEII